MSFFDEVEREVSGFASNGIRADGWRIALAEAAKSELGIESNRAGSPYRPLTVTELGGGTFVVQWSDGLVSRGSLSRAPAAQIRKGRPFDLISAAQQFDGLVISVEPGSVVASGGQKTQRQPPGIHYGIRHPHCRQQLWIQLWFPLQCLVRRYVFGGDSAFTAGRNKLFPIGQVLIVQCDKQTAVFFKRSGGDAAQGAVFGDAFTGCNRIMHDIACAAVQEPMVSSCGAAQQLAFFTQRHSETPQHQIMGQGRTGAATPDDKNMSRFFFCVRTHFKTLN